MVLDVCTRNPVTMRIQPQFHSQPSEHRRSNHFSSSRILSTHEHKYWTWNRVLDLKSPLPEIPTSITQTNLFEGLFLRWHFVGKSLISAKPFDTFDTLSPRVAVMDPKDTNIFTCLLLPSIRTSSTSHGF